MAYFNTCAKCGCEQDKPLLMVPDGYEMLTADKKLIKKYNNPLGGQNKKPRYVIETYRLNF